MKKGIFILTLMILALFSVSCAFASDVNDTLAASEDNQFTDEIIQEIQDSDLDEICLNDEDSSTDAPCNLEVPNSSEVLGESRIVTINTFDSIDSAISYVDSGDTIYFEPGTHTLNRPIELSWRNNVKIIGNSTVLDAQGQTYIFEFFYCNNITIQNITFKTD